MAKKRVKQLLSIKEAEAQGIERVRKPIWANPLDHLHIKPYAAPGIWTHLYCPFNQECNKRDPVEILRFQLDLNAKEYEPYTGPLPESEEYKADAAQYARCLSDRSGVAASTRSTGT